MTTSTYDELVAKLTGPGGSFELATELIGGREVRNFVNRRRSVRELVAYAGERRPNEDFIVDGDRRVTFGEFAALVWGAAAELQELFGVRQGSRVAILARNSLEWLVVAFAATSVGGVIVALNTWWSDEEIQYALDDSKPTLLLADSEFVDRLQSGVETDDIETILIVGKHDAFRSVSEVMVEGSEVPQVRIQESDPFVILYTSGTTGRAKGCITTHGGTVTQLYGMLLSGVIGREMASDTQTRRPAGRRPASLVTNPFFHVAGLHAAVGGALMTGMRLVLFRERFDPEVIIELIEREHITVLGAVPTLVQRIISHPAAATHDLSSLESVSIGAAPVSGALVEATQEILGTAARIGNGWGLTEAHGGVTMNAGRDLAGKPGSVGRVHPYLDLRVVDEHFNDVPPGAIGELLVRGPTVTPGYWNQPDVTADTIRDGWLRTGDIGYQDEQSFVYLVDRAKDIIIRGGENISSFEIEHALAEHPLVSEVAVIGAPDPDLGEVIAAIVYAVPGAELTIESLEAFAASRLPRIKRPAIFRLAVQPLPRNATGKLVKRELRDQLNSTAPAGDQR